MEPDLYELISAWLGRPVEPARREELLARLRQDEAFRAAFVAEIRMLAMLKMVQSPESRWLRLEDELGWSALEPTAAEPLEDRILQKLEPHRPRKKWWRVAAAAAIAASLLLATVVALTGRRQGSVKPILPVVAQPYPKVDTADGLAMVVKLDGVRWEPASAPQPVVGNVLAAGRFRFSSGRAILSMLTGVVLHVEGPADIELIGPERILCRQGKIRAQVPDGAEGFLVLGPSSAVVDLGTEFGLNVQADGKLRGRVFEGSVEAAVLSESGTPQRTFLLSATDPEASEAFEIDSASRQIEPVEPSEDFIAAADPVAPALELGEGYASAVREARPWGYWRFQTMDARAIPNEVPDRPPLKATGPIALGGGKNGNRWAEFLPRNARQFLALAEPWHPSWDPGYAVEFWCMARSIGHQSVVSLVNPMDTDHHVFLMELTSRNRLTMHKPASVRLLHRWPPGWQGGDNTFSQEPYVPYRWHHIVGQVRGDQIEIYLDGQRSSSVTVSQDHSDLPCQLILGRLSTRRGTGLSIDRPFLGRIDEFALYDHPLDSEAIRKHYRLGAQAPAAR